MSYSDETPYAELHAHSTFSFLDGVSEPEELVDEALRLGLGALALTDHNGLYGIVRFSKATEGLPLFPVYGAELTIGSDHPRTKTQDPPGSHLVVLARSPKGYSELSKVITKGHLAGGEKGRFSLSLLDVADGFSGEWMVLTGCRKGFISRALDDGGPSEARRELAKLIEIFGRQNVVIECFDNNDPVDVVRNEVFVGLAAESNILAIATGNVHYATPKQGRLAHVVSSIRANRSLDEMEGWLASYHSRHLRSAKEQQKRFARFPGLLAASWEVATKCSFDLSLVAPSLPAFIVPSGHSEITWLRSLVSKMAGTRYGERWNERVEGAYRQIDYELDVIEKLGFAGYFLVVWDIVQFCKAQDIFCQGRGSAANSAVCYALGITNCDPVALRLLFERFLSPERDGPPDIDVDIESDRREEVIQYVYRKYGRDMAAQVASVVTYRSRSVIKDVGKAMGYPDSLVAKWSKEVERWGSLSSALKLKDPMGNAVLELPKEVAEMSLCLEGRPRHLGLHVGGMVICDRPIAEVCPIEWARSAKRSVLQWDKDDCAAIGLVKFDLLGLGMLSALHESVDLVEEFYDLEVDLALIPQEDEVYEMLCEADTIGVFQVESRAQMATLPRLKPREFYDLVVEVALIRPGPIQGGSVHPYIRRRNGLEPVTYLHPLLENSLSKTLGVPLFQEQLMQMAIDVAGFSPAEADQLRQAMSSKRSSVKMERLRERFYDGMAERGVEGEVADLIFEKLAAFANFGFPESHSASFAYLVYASAWLKLYYPAAFCAALLRSQPMGFWAPQTLIQDVRRHGVEVLGPEVGLSAEKASLLWNLESRDGAIGTSRRQRYGATGPSLRLGLDAVRGISREVALKIVERGPYQDLEDFVLRTEIKKPQLEALSRANALKGFDGGKLTRREALWMVGPLSQRSERSLVGMAAIGSVPTFASLARAEEMALDISSMGLVPDGHPMEVARASPLLVGVTTSADLVFIESGEMVKVAGVVTHRQRPQTAKGVTFINLEDETGLINVICSRAVWTRDRSAARSSSALLVSGRLESVDGVMNVVAQEILPLFSLSSPASRDFQ